jgi:putative endonuclease
MSYWVYIVACADDTYYTGVATDVARRLAQHNGEKPKGARYTSARRPVTLVYQAPCATRSEAQKAEARIKALSRAEKLALIISARLNTPQLAEAAAS